jgi:hypothetical protein
MSIPNSCVDLWLWVKITDTPVYPPERPLAFTIMSDAGESLGTPVPYIGNASGADTYVFSSPARDVGWSPSAANTPLGLTFHSSSESSTDFMSYVIESRISPIRRAHRFPRFATESRAPRSLSYQVGSGLVGRCVYQAKCFFCS